MALSRAKTSALPEENACAAGYITLCLTDFFFGGEGGRGRGCVHIIIVSASA